MIFFGQDLDSSLHSPYLRINKYLLYQDGEEEIPAWCNPAVEMGGWLNFGKIRTICADLGYTEFGPYGGVPAPADEEGGDDPAGGDSGKRGH